MVEGSSLADYILVISQFGYFILVITIVIIVLYVVGFTVSCFSTRSFTLRHLPRPNQIFFSGEKILLSSEFCSYGNHMLYYWLLYCKSGKVSLLTGKKIYYVLPTMNHFYLTLSNRLKYVLFYSTFLRHMVNQYCAYFQWFAWSKDYHSPNLQRNWCQKQEGETKASR